MTGYDSPILTLLYDGLCPVCSREIALLRRLDRHRRLAFEDIAADAFDPSRYGLTMDEVIGSMHARRSDGTIVTGMEVFRLAYDAVGMGWMLAPTAWPLLRPIADAGYRLFARIRPRLSSLDATCDDGRCAVTPPARRSSSTAPAPDPGR